MQTITRTENECRNRPEPQTSEAEKFAALRISEVQRGVFVKPVHIPLSELWGRYFAYAKSHKRSWKRDEQMYGNLSSFFGSVNLDAVTHLRVEDFQQHRAQEVSPATVNRECALLKHMFNMAERWEMHSGKNPVRLVKFLPENNLQYRTLSEEEEQRLLECSPPYLREMILFALNIGLRTNEIFALTWREVDIEERRLKMIVKKTEKSLSLPLNEAALSVIESRYGNQHGPYVFYSPMTGDRFKNVRGALDAASKRAGLKNLTWHMFRHTFASRLTRTGVDIVTVKDLLGHSNISTTLRYAHSNDEAKRRAVERLKTCGKVVTIVPRRAIG